MDGLQMQEGIQSTLQRVPDRLPVSPELLAAPVANGVRTFLQQRFTGFLQRPAVQELWIRANRFAHDRVVSLLRGESDNASIEGNVVYLDLLPLVNDLLAEVEECSRTSSIERSISPRPRVNVPRSIPALEQRFGIDLPDDFGKIRVFESDRLAAAQRRSRSPIAW